jgi:hypothetical protein
MWREVMNYRKCNEGRATMVHDGVLQVGRGAGIRTQRATYNVPQITSSSLSKIIMQPAARRCSGKWRVEFLVNFVDDADERLCRGNI